MKPKHLPSASICLQCFVVGHEESTHMAVPPLPPLWPRSVAVDRQVGPTERMVLDNLRDHDDREVGPFLPSHLVAVDPQVCPRCGCATNGAPVHACVEFVELLRVKRG